MIVAELDKGKGREVDEVSGSEEGTDSGGSASDERYIYCLQVTVEETK